MFENVCIYVSMHAYMYFARWFSLYRYLIAIGEVIMGYKLIAMIIGVKYVISMNADRSMLTKVVRGHVSA